SGITWFKETRDGEVEVHLTNFDAQIVTDITRDDGAQVTREFEIEAVMDNGSFQFSVQARGFNALHWVAQYLGARALGNPTPGARARTPHAIQSLSRPLSRTIYAHTGWRKINDVWCFLHGGGALGADGQLADVEVTLSTQINACVLGIDADKT